MVLGNNCFTCNRGTTVTGGRGHQLSSFQLCVNLRCILALTPWGCLCCLSVLCLSRFRKCGATLRCCGTIVPGLHEGVCKTTGAGQQGNSPLLPANITPDAGSSLETTLSSLSLVVISEVFCCPLMWCCKIHSEEQNWLD